MFNPEQFDVALQRMWRSIEDVKRMAAEAAQGRETHRKLYRQEADGTTDVQQLSYPLGEHVISQFDGAVRLLSLSVADVRREMTIEE